MGIKFDSIDFDNNSKPLGAVNSPIEPVLAVIATKEPYDKEPTISHPLTALKGRGENSG